MANRREVNDSGEYRLSMGEGNSPKFFFEDNSPLVNARLVLVDETWPTSSPSYLITVLYS